MAQTSDITNLLQRFYTGKAEQTFSDEFWAHKEFESVTNLKWEGESVRISIHTGRNDGAGAIGELDDLPVAGSQTTQQGEVSRKFVYGRINLSGPAIWAAQSEAHSFKAVLDFEMERLVADIIAQRSFYLYTSNVVAGNANLNGIRARINGVPAPVLAAGVVSGTITLDEPGGISTTFAPAIGGTRYLRNGDRVVWGSAAQLSAGGTAEGAGIISAINRSAQTATLTQTSSAVIGDFPDNNDLICRGWSTTSHEGGKCPQGLGTLVNFQVGQDLQGITFESETWAATNTNAAGAFDINKLHVANQNIREVSGKKTDVMVAHPSFSRQYIDDLKGDVRFDPKKIEGGYETLTFSSGNPIKFVFDNDAPYGAVIFMNKGSIFWAVNRPWSWDKTDGDVLRSVSNKDQYTARYVSYYDMAYRQLNCNGWMHGVTVSNTIF